MQQFRPKSATSKWAPILESNLGRKLKSRAEAAVVSTLLETQCKLNKGFLPESANVSADVAQYQQYALPLVRRQFPDLLAMQTVATIPTTTPNGIYFALRFLYDDEAPKTVGFRNGLKKEIGYDLVADHTGVHGTFNPWTTTAGEMLSNYAEGTFGGPTFDGHAKNTLNNSPTHAYLANHWADQPSVGDMYNEAEGHYNIKKASIKVVSGAIRVGTKAIKSHYTLELQQDMAAAHGQDVEALLLEGLQFEIQQEIDREILAAMVSVAQNPMFGGEKAILVDLSKNAHFQDGRWVAERIAGGIVNTIIAVARKISLTTRMGSGNFAICSPSIVAAISTLNSGIYIPTYLGTDAAVQPGGGVSDAGSLLNGQIKLYQDIYSWQDYALVGYKGPRQGESGIIFMPYIPYIFCKTAGQEDGSPRLIVKSRYAIVSNLLGCGLFYRVVRFVNNDLLGVSFTGDIPWESNEGPTVGVTLDTVGVAEGGHTLDRPFGTAAQEEEW